MQHQVFDDGSLILLFIMCSLIVNENYSRNTHWQASGTWENQKGEEEIKKTPCDIKAIIKFDSDEGNA